MANMLYNGVELPDIESVWTGDVKNKYSFATIHKSGSAYVLNLFSIDSFYYESGNIYSNQGYTGSKYQVTSSDFNWKSFTEDGYWSGGFVSVAPFWSSFDIPDASGSIWLPGSSPVDPNASTLPDLTSAETLRWISLGMAVRRGIRARGEATMYSYNGTVLPKLPEWDREKYPYALVCYKSDGVTPYLRLISARPYCEYVSHHNAYMIRAQNFNYYYYVLSNNKWEFDITGTGVSGSLGQASLFFWTSTDILNTDGTIYLAASDPIPVYE